jgi:DNA helicase HerA-like ATPase
MTNETYYGGDEEYARDAVKDMYSPSRMKSQFSEGCVNKVLGGRHVLVVGKTGSGKTYWMAKVCNMLPSYIFVNPQEEEIVDTITQVVTDDENQVIELLEDGNRRIQFLPDEDDLAAIEQLETIRKALWSVASEMKIEDGQWWMNMIIDEAQIYAPLGSRTDLQSFARRGRRYGVKSWFLSQQPQDLAKGIVNNVDYQVLFQLGQYSSIYFKNYRIPISLYQQWIEKPYHYVLYDGQVITPCRPI